MRSVLSIIVVALACWTIFLPVAQAVDVIGDDGSDRYVGSGGLVLPGSVDQQTRVRVAECADCRWRMTDPCQDDAGSTGCRSVTRGCPNAFQLLRAWISRDGGRSWEDLGVVCIPPSGPVTVDGVQSEIREDFERSLPAGGITYQPPTGVLPYLPVVFHSGQPASIPPSEHVVAGVTVILAPVPRWTWEFGDGAQLTTRSPGSRYPDLTVAHAYRRGGPHQVRLTTTWTASVTIDGLGPFEVTGPVIQESSARVRVGQARAVLVP